mmetsp:Transcript_9588/g.33691  ORF Transcript_9588/g.33691 Transcript_9588/m.33691 type:complete len:360 (-) Transcript_9588:442-1521(-)
MPGTALNLPTLEELYSTKLKVPLQARLTYDAGGGRREVLEAKLTEVKYDPGHKSVEKRLRLCRAPPRPLNPPKPPTSRPTRVRSRPTRARPPSRRARPSATREQPPTPATSQICGPERCSWGTSRRSCGGAAAEGGDGREEDAGRKMLARPRRRAARSKMVSPTTRTTAPPHATRRHPGLRIGSFDDVDDSETTTSCFHRKRTSDPSSITLPTSPRSKNGGTIVEDVSTSRWFRRRGRPWPRGLFVGRRRWPLRLGRRRGGRRRGPRRRGRATWPQHNSPARRTQRPRPAPPAPDRRGASPTRARPRCRLPRATACRWRRRQPASGRSDGALSRRGTLLQSNGAVDAPPHPCRGLTLEK